MPNGYFHYESDSSLSSTGALSSPPTSLLNRPSLDLSPTSSQLNDPFVDPRLSLDSWSRSSIHSGGGREESKSPQREVERPQMPPSRPSEMQRQLQAAISDDQLPTPVNEQPPRRSKVDEVAGEEMERSSSRRSSSGGGGLLSQFRTGSGWFGPVVPPEPKLSRAEREALEKARIEELRTQGTAANRKRPSFMKRMSSGVEMMSSFAVGDSLSPKGGRSRSGTTSTITESNRGGA